ncbi:CopG family ribbon-helix-helix protein [Marinomonas sp.]|uniref:CopG family ribbon-helix-helix protein n=1 Tax=Marinomonas sp. TaxID=1904862 RepID=UPI003BABBAA1
MSLKATSVRLDEETLQPVGQMAEAIKQYVARKDWFIREVEKGIESADKGQ